MENSFMRKKIVVAVIDSGMDFDDRYIKGKLIKEYRYNKGVVECHSAGSITKINNTHGTEVSKIILKENPNVRIVSIQILHDNNHGMLSELIKAIDLCVSLKVDIINISLGVSNARSDLLESLQKAIWRAISAGIEIIAADNNSQIGYSYPANFKDVIGVKNVIGMKEYVSFDCDNKMVFFSNSLVCVPNIPRYMIKKGNSFLCPLITGVYSKWFVDRNLHLPPFKDFVNDFVKEMISKVFFNHYEEKDRNLVIGKNVLFFTDKMDQNNTQIYNMYKEVCDIKLCFEEVIRNNIEDIIDNVKKNDILFIGALSGEFIQKNEEYLKTLISIMIDYINIITVYPLLNISERIKLCRKTPHYLKSIYM